METEEVLALLRSALTEAGGQRQWALRQGLSPTYVADVASGRREPGPKVLAALGLERVKATSYRKVGTAPAPSG